MPSDGARPLPCAPAPAPSVRHAVVTAAGREPKRGGGRTACTRSAYLHLTRHAGSPTPPPFRRSRGAPVRAVRAHGGAQRQPALLWDADDARL
eukprot:6201430-Pleurochrysis_carterae.AAC.1